VVRLVAKVPVALPVQPFEPALPPLTALHEKVPALFDAPTARNGPGVGWVTVTVLVLAPVVTPIPAAHVPVPIAVARLEAMPVVVEAVAKVPVKVGAVPLHAFVPLLPPVTPPHEKMPVLLEEVGVKVETVASPRVLSVAVTVLVLDVALTPAALQPARLIAAARFVARVDWVLLVV